MTAQPVKPSESATTGTPQRRRGGGSRGVVSRGLPPDRFMNRELGWLEFNQRVLEQAADDSVPLLERAKFLAITGSNLDEFVMVRVGGLKLQFENNALVTDPAGLTVGEQLQAVSKRCHSLVERQHELLRESIEPGLSAVSIERVDLESCGERTAEAAERRFRDEVTAVLSPQALQDRPFPMLAGLGVHLCVRLRPDVDARGRRAESNDVADEQGSHFAVIPLGRTVPRVVSLPADRGYAYVLLEDLVSRHINEFFPGREVLECVPFRLTRNADIRLREDAAGDLMEDMEEVLDSRRQSRVVRLELDANASDETIAYLTETLELGSQDLYRVDGPLDLTYLFAIHGLEGFDDQRDPPWTPQATPQIATDEPMFATVAAGDVLMVHPFERFDPVVRLLEEAAVDPDVLAIKQSLYRTSRDSPIVAALKRAAEHGKYVSAVVELKARFDEARNIEWAREMERAGVQVIYGLRGLKTHAKVCIIVRREPQGLARYVHFGTGNYNEVTARLYSDVSLLTCDASLGSDATTFFNAVTGASQPGMLQQLASAPTGLRQRLLDLIDAETRRCREGQEAEIVAKLNALVDTQIIDALYQASRAGVRIRLNVRGICCLRPGIRGLSETIEVVSIVDRFLEHARVFYFRHGGDEQLFISSADWMPRNLDRRVELMVPVLDPACRKKLLDTIRVYFQDNTNAWRMLSSGMYRRIHPAAGEPPIRSQRLLYDRAVAAARDAKATRRGVFEPHHPREREN